MVGLPLPEGRGPGARGRTPAAGGERAWSTWADSRCRRGGGLEHVGGLPLPKRRGPGMSGVSAHGGTVYSCRVQCETAKIKTEKQMCHKLVVELCQRGGVM